MLSLWWFSELIPHLFTVGFWASRKLSIPFKDQWVFSLGPVWPWSGSETIFLFLQEKYGIFCWPLSLHASWPKFWESYIGNNFCLESRGVQFIMFFAFQWTFTIKIGILLRLVTVELAVELLLWTLAGQHWKLWLSQLPWRQWWTE